METIVVECDRCHKEVIGLYSENGTAGYYNVEPGSIWAKYANPTEKRLCDQCMQSDPRYLADYPTPKMAEGKTE